MTNDAFVRARALKAVATHRRDVKDLDSAYSMITEAIELLENALDDGIVHKNDTPQIYAELADLYGSQGGILQRLGKIEASLRSFEAGKTYDRINKSNTSAFIPHNQAQVAISLWFLSDHPNHDPELRTKLRSAIRLRNGEVTLSQEGNPWTLADLAILYLMDRQYEQAQRTFAEYSSLCYDNSSTTAILAKVWMKGIEFDQELALVAEKVFTELGGDPRLLVRRVKFHSCFISVASKDNNFAKFLYENLKAHGVNCWYAPVDIKIGDPVRSAIEDAIRVHDKTILVLSRNSIESDWVEHEVSQALEQENLTGKLVLFPIRIDNTIFETKFGWAKRIREAERQTGRHIGDFTLWKRRDRYEKAFARLLRDLKINGVSG